MLLKEIKTSLANCALNCHEATNSIARAYELAGMDKLSLSPPSISQVAHLADQLKAMSDELAQYAFEVLFSLEHHNKRALHNVP